MDHPQWPALSLAEWQDTYLTLHRWTQIVGKIRLALAPPLNAVPTCVTFTGPYAAGPAKACS